MTHFSPEVRGRSHLGLVLVCAFVCAFGLPAASWPAQAQDLEGAYTIDAAASDNIEAAIVSGTADMNFAIRPLARSLTAKTNPRYERIEIRRGDTNVSVRFDSRPPIEMPNDGHAVRWVREDGGIYNVSVEWSAAQMVMHFQSENGDRTNTLVLEPDGATLKFKVKLTSAHLPAPILYVLIFRRQPG
jgi:hypothetical protein